MSITDRRAQNRTILDAADSTGAGLSIDVTDYRHITVCVATANSANLTVKCAGSIGVDADDTSSPDFDSAQALDNCWDTIAMYEYQDPSTITAGDTGVAFTGTDDVILYTVNTDMLKWLTFNVTARAAGDVTVFITPVNNQ